MKVIIDIKDKTPVNRAICCAYSVILGGYRSKGRGIPHYCWVTRFADKTIVETRQKKTRKSPESFVVYTEI